MSLRTLTLLILLFLLPLPQLHAQNSSRSARLDVPPPNAVLVQLNTGTRRINTLRQKGQIEKAEALQLVIQSIRETMADDFKITSGSAPSIFSMILLFPALLKDNLRAISMTQTFSY